MGREGVQGLPLPQVPHARCVVLAASHPAQTTEWVFSNSSSAQRKGGQGREAWGMRRPHSW
jgi:hypothetical protein